METRSSPGCSTVWRGGEAKVLHRDLASAVGPGDDGPCAQHDERGDAVGARGCVAEVATEAGAPLDLDAADQRCGVDEAGVCAGYGGVLVESVAGDRRAHAEPLFGAVGELVELRHGLGVHEPLDVAPTGPHFDKDVRAPGQDPRRLALLGQGADGLGQGARSNVLKLTQ